MLFCFFFSFSFSWPASHKRPRGDLEPKFANQLWRTGELGAQLAGETNCVGFWRCAFCSIDIAFKEPLVPSTSI
ncbi:hypothetical protein BJY01DRAFT_12402 [Aspergillus pseudoustus]|uniref:Secreted protein n=1 Tax=Aspergillus pseudoustus TaxID=1810923 RepID=A0ABR4JN15_9EURO